MKKKIIVGAVAVIILIAAFFVPKIVSNRTDVPDSSTSSEEEIPSIETSEEEVLLSAEDFEYFLDIPIAKIHTPVMQSEDNDYWLRRNLDGEPDVYGTPFFDFRCNVANGRNVIIYGHASEDMGLFGMLSNYLEDEIALTEPITLYINGEAHQYLVVSVYRHFSEDPYIYTKVNFNGDTEFLEWAEELESYSLVNTGRTISVTDNLLTLQTCVLDGSGDYLIVIAKKV